MPKPPIRVECPHCRRAYLLAARLVGRSAKCGGCRRLFRIAAAAPVADPTGPTRANR